MRNSANALPILLTHSIALEQLDFAFQMMIDRRLFQRLD